MTCFFFLEKIGSFFKFKNKRCKKEEHSKSVLQNIGAVVVPLILNLESNFLE